MYKDISPADRSIKEFKTYKQFTFTHSDSGSGVFGLEGISGSFHNFQTGSAASQSFGTYNEASKSLGHPWDTWYSNGTFFKLPLYAAPRLWRDPSGAAGENFAKLSNFLKKKIDFSLIFRKKSKIFAFKKFDFP